MKLENLRYIFKPSFWSMLNPYSSSLDGHILKHIENNEVKIISEYYVKCGSASIWTANYPYSYATFKGCRPSRNTIEKLREHILEISLKGDEKDD